MADSISASDLKSLIYIVDDSSDDRAFMSSGLQSLGFSNIEFYANGLQALDALKDAKVLPSLVFLDINMHDAMVLGAEGFRYLVKNKVEEFYKDHKVICIQKRDQKN